MTVTVHAITFDCADARALADFWADLTGWNVFYDEDDNEVLVAPHYPNDDGTSLLFIRVPEGKTAKNRIHLDLAPTDAGRDEQVEHALDLGATLLDDRRQPDGAGWVVLADPEGNEFCIVRSEAERGGQAPRAIKLA